MSRQRLSAARQSCSLLSYRHAYHAGNFADVLKHLVLVELLEHFIKKPKPFDYIDSHAGAGHYSLISAEAQKTGESAAGIGRLRSSGDASFASYLAAIDAAQNGQPNSYPGSPAIAAQYLRPGDRSWLFERHPRDVNTLRELFARQRSVRVSDGDGFAGLLAQLPPQSRRAIVLMDPSYEIKADYVQVAETLLKAHKKFATGCYALWYPVVDRAAINALQQRFVRSEIRNIQQFELAVRPELGGAGATGMTASGMIVINPPYTLMAAMQRRLPALQQALGGVSHRAVSLVDE